MRLEGGMDVTYGQLSLTGPVRSNNEDYLGSCLPADAQDARNRGALVVLADGMGGQEAGEVASRLAVEAALQKFRDARAGVSPNQLVGQMFAAANQAVYDEGNKVGDQRRMGTTLTIALFRNNEVTIGHVGDCRTYLIQNGQIRRLTSDHSYVGVQVKLGLISEQEALQSPMRSVLTRCIGKDPVVQVDYTTAVVGRGDFVMQCCDGVYCYITENDILEAVAHAPPAEACKHLTDLAIKRGTDDNVSVQIVHVERVEQLSYYRGAPVYQESLDPTMSHEVQIGEVLDGRFRVVDVIARSGMASIYKANDLQTGKRVAVKVPGMQFESDPGFFTRFQREEEIGRVLDHPYILHIIPMEQKSRPYMAMELLEGQTLRQLMRGVPRLPVPDALKITSRLCEALDYMHKKNIIHRDLKPENVMICEDGTLRIMDFGIAKAAGMRRLTFSGFSPVMGTPDYMAPEQVKGKRGDERTDLYSLGAMLYEMVTGVVPFEGANPYIIMNSRVTGDPVAPRKVHEDIPAAVEEIILHAMERNPAERYPSAAAMKAEVDDPDKVELTGRCDRLQPPSLARTNWATVRLVVISALVPVVILGGALLYLHFWPLK
jgi:serine/threonine protein phosphatase PrpC